MTTRETLQYMEVENKAKHVTVSQGITQTVQDANQGRKGRYVTARTLSTECMTARDYNHLTF